MEGNAELIQRGAQALQRIKGGTEPSLKALLSSIHDGTEVKPVQDREQLTLFGETDVPIK